MSAISGFINTIRNAVYGEQVRGAIVSALEQCYSDVNAPSLQTEAFEAALNAAYAGGILDIQTVTSFNSMTNQNIIYRYNGTAAGKQKGLYYYSALSNSWVLIGSEIQKVSLASQMTDVNDIYKYIGTESGMVQNSLYCHNGTAWVPIGSGVLTAATAAAMTNTGAIYKYTGTESGMVQNALYYNDGTSWVPLEVQSEETASYTIPVELENGYYDNTANRYNDNFSASVINRKPIVLNGATKIRIEGVPSNITTGTVYTRSSNGSAIRSVTATFTNGVSNEIAINDGEFYIDFTFANFNYRAYNVCVTAIGGTSAPEQTKRIYSNQGGTTIVRFHLNKDLSDNTCTAFRLPPNYAYDGTPVPLVVFFAGSMEYPNIGSGFANAYNAGINYVRDEGFAVMQVFSWGSDYASKYSGCGNDQPFSVPICLLAIRKGIEYMCDRYNIDPESVHVVAKSVGGIIANYFVSRPVWNFKSISMFDPCLDFISMRGRYGGGRRAIAAALDLQGDLDEFYAMSYWYFSDEGKAFWRLNKEKLILLNPAWLDLIGGTFQQNFDDSFADAKAWWADKTKTDVYTHNEYKRLGKVPTKIWGAPDDAETPYPIMATTIAQLQNGGCFSELRTLPTGTGGHFASTGTTNVVASITTALGITHTNIPVAWAECVPWIRLNCKQYATEIITPDVPDVPEDCPYEKDGLVFWLDGKTVDSATEWTDLVGNKKFALSNCTKSSNGVVFNGSTSLGTYNGSIGGATIEVAYTTASQTDNAAILCQPNSSISMATAKYNSIDYVITEFGTANRQFRRITKTANELISSTAAFGTNMVVINKTQQTATGQYQHWDTNATGKAVLGARFVGAQTPLWQFNGTIHSIRIYNRELTAAEMQSNQQVDVERFGLSV